MSASNAASYNKSQVDPSKWSWYNRDYSAYKDWHKPKTETVTVTKPKRFNPLLFVLSVILFVAALTPYLFEAVFMGEPLSVFSLGLGAFLILGTLAIAKAPVLENIHRIMIFAVPAVLLIVSLLLFNGAPMVALAIYGSVAATALGHYAFWASIAAKGYTTTNRVEVVDNGQRVYGEPGGVADAAEVFGEANVKAGAAGEKATAELLDMMLRIPGTYVYHGLKFPGSERADVDHAVINGNRVFLIDSKQFRAGDYYWGYARNEATGEDEEYICSGNGAQYKNHMNSAAQGYSAYLKKHDTSANVSTIVIIHGNAATTAPGGERSHNNIVLSTPQDAMEIIGGSIQEPGKDNRALRKALLGMLK